jgi:hypothetical protein
VRRRAIALVPCILVALVPLGQTQPLIARRPGMVIERSVTIRPGVYRLSSAVDLSIPFECRSVIGRSGDRPSSIGDLGNRPIEGSMSDPPILHGLRDYTSPIAGLTMNRSADQPITDRRGADAWTG